MRIVVLALIVGVMLASCDEEPVAAGGGGSTEGSVPAGGGGTTPRPTTGPSGPLEFVLNAQYEEGTKVPVRLRNTSRRSFIYNSYYEACEMSYEDASGREFIIPPGTHCDLIVEDEIAPGETVTLFKWELDECTKDRWGCAKSEPLAPGMYSIHGAFKPQGGGEAVRVAASFRIVDA